MVNIQITEGRRPEDVIMDKRFKTAYSTKAMWFRYVPISTSQPIILEYTDS